MIPLRLSPVRFTAANHMEGAYRHPQPAAMRQVAQTLTDAGLDPRNASLRDVLVKSSESRNPGGMIAENLEASVRGINTTGAHRQPYTILVKRFHASEVARKAELNSFRENQSSNIEKRKLDYEPHHNYVFRLSGDSRSVMVVHDPNNAPAGEPGEL